MIHSMDLHTIVTTPSGWVITRVAGGWIYGLGSLNDPDGLKQCLFVPFNNEFVTEF